MRKHLFKVNQEGLVMECVNVDFDEDGKPIGDVDVDIILTSCPTGFHRPRWNGIVWVEDMTQEEIENRKSQIQEPSFEEMQIEYNVDLDYRLSLIEMGLV